MEQPPRDNLERAARLVELFRAAGCEPVAYPVAGRKIADNIECTLPGGSEEQILFGAHTDTVPSSPGVIDNWSGTVMLTALYEALSSSPRKDTHVFVGFSGEELGLLGSSAYLRMLKKQKRPKPVVMVNLDTLGSGPVQVESDQSNDLLLRAFQAVLHHDKAEVRVMNLGNVAESDFVSFRLAGVPVLILHSLTREQVPNLHGRYDNFEMFDMSIYYKTYRQLAMFGVMLEDLLDAHRDQL
jgi:Zn-dependent M28 family amino/carboxypeptidase